MPARLDKQPEVSPLMNNWDMWVSTHITLILFVLVVILFVLVVGLLFMLWSMPTVPTATEANTYYYGLERII